MAMVSPITWTPEARHQLALTSAYWRHRLDLLHRQCPCIPWTPGLRLTSELRACYEQVVPIATVCHSLSKLAAEVLPHRSWVPRLLRTRTVHMERRVWAHGPASVPDLWVMMPSALAGRLSFTPEEMGLLLCTLADPPHFGTDTARYPEQRHQLRRELKACAARNQSVRLLDLACGVGHGTLEAAALAQDVGVTLHSVLGITLEPLEAWMAAHRVLPHSPQRQNALACLPHHLPVHFASGDVRCCPCRGPFDMILCNGLIGGAALNTGADTSAFLREMTRLVAANGCVLAANRFHAGKQGAVESFIRQATASGWVVGGRWQALTLHHSSPPDRTISG